VTRSSTKRSDRERRMTRATARSRNDGQMRGGVGAVVLHYRFWPEIAQTLDALLSQTRPPDDVIVVDNHSHDGSVSRIRAAYPQLQVIESPRNGGYGAGMNLGVEELQERDVAAVLLLTHECRLAPTALETLVGRLNEAPSVGAVGPLLGFLETPDIVFSAGGWVEPKWGTRHQRQPSAMSEWAAADPQRVECLDGAALLLRTDALRQAGRMDERYFMYFEETEYVLRLRRLGWSVECVPRAVGWQQPAPKTPVLWDRNRLRFLARNAGKAVLARETARLVRDVARELRPGVADEHRARAKARARALLYFLARRWGPIPDAAALAVTLGGSEVSIKQGDPA
jgi:GT2 family glycosyltransferase